MVRRLRTLADCSPAEWLLLPQLALCAFLIGLALRIIDVPRLTAWLSQMSRSGWARWVPAGHGRHSPERLAVLAHYATRLLHGPGCCLRRSLILYWLLASRKVPVTLQIGVEAGDAALRSHAWVESSGVILGDQPAACARFTPMLTIETP